MKHRYQTWILCAALLATVASGQMFASDPPSHHRAPQAIDLKSLQFVIVDANFVHELRAVNAVYDQQNDRTYRGLILTVRVDKPEYHRLKLCAQDFSLHYKYGRSSSDIAPCLGISGFSTTQFVDRPMYLSKSGRKSSETGVTTSRDETVYVDLFFDCMESNTRELHLFVAQPAVKPFRTAGW